MTRTSKQLVVGFILGVTSTSLLTVVLGVIARACEPPVVRVHPAIRAVPLNNHYTN